MLICIEYKKAKSSKIVGLKLRVIKCIVNIRVINIFMNSSLYSCMSHKQDKEMDNLNLFIDYHYKYIVSIIRVKHILTLHLSTAN